MRVPVDGDIGNVTVCCERRGLLMVDECLWIDEMMRNKKNLDINTEQYREMTLNCLS